ncbi:MAG: DUF3500 domain-containing protein [Ginsengibacter sp.]
MRSTLALLLALTMLSCHAQNKSAFTNDMATKAGNFVQSLTPAQKAKAIFSFNDDERYHWNYVPIERKGISINDLTAVQRNAAMQLLHTTLSDSGYEKTSAIMQLEKVLKLVENRNDSDHYRDTGNYYFSIFGNPQQDSIWGWRFEGHHVAFNFSSDDKGLVSGTPGFLGANPAVVLSGTEKGKEILKDETRMGFELLHSLDDVQKSKAVISSSAFPEIITGSSRKAMIQNPQGVLYSDLTDVQQKMFMALLSLYINRYQKPYASTMMQDIQKAGLNNLHFTWAGDQQPGVGHPHYYCLQGPTIIIEYDNTQNNANHVHTVIRDLVNDFGGDELLKHYQQGHHH